VSDPGGFRPSTDELLGNNAAFVEGFAHRDLEPAPRRQLAVVACMDSRIDVCQMLGLAHGDAHIIRNAGGVVTDDVVRSLAISQRLLGTREIVLIHHTDCGLQKVTETGMKARLREETGVEPPWAIGAFTDPYEDVRRAMRLLEENPFIVHKEHIRGFVYDVDDGRLIEVGRQHDDG